MFIHKVSYCWKATKNVYIKLYETHLATSAELHNCKQSLNHLTWLVPCSKTIGLMAKKKHHTSTYFLNFGFCGGWGAGFENAVLLLGGTEFFLLLTTWLTWEVDDFGLLLLLFLSSIFTDCRDYSIDKAIIYQRGVGWWEEKKIYWHLLHSLYALCQWLYIIWPSLKSVPYLWLEKLHF